MSGSRRHSIQHNPNDDASKNVKSPSPPQNAPYSLLARSCLPFNASNMVHVEYAFHAVHQIPVPSTNKVQFTQITFASKQMQHRVLKHITAHDDEILVEHARITHPQILHILDKSNVTILKRDTQNDSVYSIEISKQSTANSSSDNTNVSTTDHSLNPQSTTSTSSPLSSSNTATTKRKRKRLPLVHNAPPAPQTASTNHHSSTKKRKLNTPHTTPATTEHNKYEYTDLLSAKVDPTNLNVHFYGVVVDYTTPKSTKCDLYSMTLTLTDASLANRPHSNQVKVLLSAKLEKLPQIKMVTQIFRAHRMRVNEWNSELQITNTAHSSFLVLDPQAPNQDNTIHNAPPPSLPPHTTWEAQDSAYLKLLSRIATKVLSDRRFKNNPKYLKTLESLKYNQHCYPDIIAQMVHREETENGMLLRIWDGTMYFDIGCIADVMIFSNQHTICDYLRNYPLKTFVKFRNFAFVKDRGLFSTAKSSVCVLPPNHQDAVALLQMAPPHSFSQDSSHVSSSLHEEEPPSNGAGVSNVPRPAQTISATSTTTTYRNGAPPPTTTNADSSRSLVHRALPPQQRAIIPTYHDTAPPQETKLVPISTHPHDHVPVVSLAQVLQQELCPAKFRVQVHVTGFDPLSINYFSMPFCPKCDRSLGSNFICTQCKRKVDEQDFVWHFRFAMLVKCATSDGSLRVVVEKETARKFLGLEPTNFVANIEAREELAKKIQFMQYPSHILDMCMEKYRSVSDRIVYRLSDTTLRL